MTFCLLPIDVEFDREVITDIQCLVQCHAKSLLKVNGTVTSWDDCFDKFIAIDEDAIEAARLQHIRFGFIFNQPVKINVVDSTR